MGLFDVLNGSVIELTPQQLYKKCVDSVAFIVNIKEDGTQEYGGAVVYTEDGTLITAAHVIKKANLINVVFNNGKTYSCRVVLIDEGRDLATLKIDTLDKFKPATFRTKPINIGAKLFAIGHPFRLTFSYVEGIVSQIRKDFLVPGKYVIKNAIQTDAALNPGNSGAPVFDKNGQVVAIANVTLSPKGVSEGCGLCTASDELMRFVNGG